MESTVANERVSTAEAMTDIVDKTADDEVTGSRRIVSGTDQSVSKSDIDRVDAAQAENSDDHADRLSSHRELLWVDKDADEAEIVQVAEEAFGDQIVKPELNDQEEQTEEESAKDNETVKNLAQEDREAVEVGRAEDQSLSNISVDNKENNETSAVEKTDEEKSTESGDIAESAEREDPVAESGSVKDSAASDEPGTESGITADSSEEKEQNVSVDEVSAGMITVTEETTEETAADEQPDERILDEDAEVYEPIDQTVTKPGEYSIHVTAGADAQIPADAILTVSEIPYTSLQYYTLASITKDTLSDASASVVYNRFFDISFVVDGQTIEPKAAVNVEISFNKAQELQEEQKLSVVHFAENQETISEVLENNPAMTEDGLVEGVSFETGSFSVFGVVYTVV